MYPGFGNIYPNGLRRTVRTCEQYTGAGTGFTWQSADSIQNNKNRSTAEYPRHLSEIDRGRTAQGGVDGDSTVALIFGVGAGGQVDGSVLYESRLGVREAPTPSRLLSWRLAV